MWLIFPSQGQNEAGTCALCFCQAFVFFTRKWMLNFYPVLQIKSQTLHSAVNIAIIPANWNWFYWMYTRAIITLRRLRSRLNRVFTMNLFSCSMWPTGEHESAALRQCVQTRAQLEEAIVGVLKAEAQLRGNSREVRGFKHTLNPCWFVFLLVHCSQPVLIFWSEVAAPLLYFSSVTHQWLIFCA